MLRDQEDLTACLEKMLPPTLKKRARKCHEKSGERLRTKDIISSLPGNLKWIPAHYEEHLARDGSLVNPDSSCYFCEQRLEHRRKGLDHYKKFNFVTLLDRSKAKSENKKSSPTSRAESHLNAIVNSLDGTACVIVPKSWLGKRVEVIVQG